MTYYEFDPDRGPLLAPVGLFGPEDSALIRSDSSALTPVQRGRRWKLLITAWPAESPIGLPESENALIFRHGDAAPRLTLFLHDVADERVEFDNGEELWATLTEFTRLVLQDAKYWRAVYERSPGSTAQRRRERIQPYTLEGLFDLGPEAWLGVPPNDPELVAAALVEFKAGSLVRLVPEDVMDELSHARQARAERGRRPPRF